MTARQKLIQKILTDAHLYVVGSDLRKLEVDFSNPEQFEKDFWEGEYPGVQDCRNELRETGIDTGLDCDWHSNYESKSVAAKMLDGSWVGWTYWYGGGKHGRPEEIDWIEDAYDLDCNEEEKLMIVRTFEKK